jgi:hypothetical protein
VTPIPSAPPRNPRSRRYPVSVMMLAKSMYADGDSWTPTQIRDYLRTHVDGCEGISENTIRFWVVPGEADQHRRANLARYHARQAKAKAAANAAPPPPPVAEQILDTPRKRLRRLRALREAGLTYTAISKVFELDTGVYLDPNQLRQLLGRRNRRDLSHGWDRKLMGQVNGS